MKNKKIITIAPFIKIILLVFVFCSTNIYRLPIIEASERSSPSDGSHEKVSPHGHEKSANHEGENKVTRDVHEEGEEEGHEEKQTIRLSKTEMKEFGIEVAIAQRGNFRNFITAPGEVVMNTDRVAHVTPRVAGFVRRIFKSVGERVKKGDVLAILDSIELVKAKIEYSTSITEIGVAKMELERFIGQVDIARSNRDIALTILEVAKAKLKMAEANLERQQELHDNVAQILIRVKEGTDLEQLTQEFRGKIIGESRADLFKTYSSLKIAKENYEREQTLLQKQITSKADFLQAQQEYEDAKSEFGAIYNEIEFQTRLSLIEMRQALQVAKEEVKSAEQGVSIAGQSIKAAQQEVKVAQEKIKLVRSKFQASEWTLHSYGLSNRSIEALKRSQQDHMEVPKYTIISPIDGVIIEKHLRLGENLTDETGAFVIADFSSVWLDLKIYQKDLPLVRAGQPVKISAAKGIPETQGSIAYIGPVVGETTRTALARVILSNAERLWKPGMFVTGKIEIHDRSVPLLIPKTALQTMGNRQVIFVQKGEGFEPVPIEIGSSNATQVEITKGLSAGQRYVSKGAFTLKAQMAKGSFGHGGH